MLLVGIALTPRRRHPMVIWASLARGLRAIGQIILVGVHTFEGRRLRLSMRSVGRGMVVGDADVLRRLWSRGSSDYNFGPGSFGNGGSMAVRGTWSRSGLGRT